MNLKNNNALTLTELIAATILFGIVIAGVASLDFALSQTRKGTSQSSIITMQTSSIMLRISKEAELATGDQANPGIVININPTNIWIRHEDPTNPTPDPSSYADDTWVSFTYNPVSHNIFFCTIPDNPTAPPTTTCPNGSENIGTLASFIPNLVNDATLGNQNFYLEVTLINRFDPTIAVNAFDNPECTLTSRIHPTSFSY